MKLLSEKEINNANSEMSVGTKGRLSVGKFVKQFFKINDCLFYQMMGDLYATYIGRYDFEKEKRIYTIWSKGTKVAIKIAKREFGDGYYLKLRKTGPWKY